MSTLAATIYQHTPAGLFAVDVNPREPVGRRYRFASISPAYERRLGALAVGVEGRTLRELVPRIPQDLAEAVEERFEQCVAERQAVQYEFEVPVGGQLAWWLLTAAPVVDEAGEVRQIAGSTVEITDTKRAQSELAHDRWDAERFAERLSGLHQLSTSRFEGFDQLYEGYLNMGVEALGLPVGIVSRIQDDTYTIRAVVDPAGVYGAGDAFPLGNTPCSTVIEGGSTVSSDDFRQDGRFIEHPAYAEGGPRGYISTPIRVGDRLFGTLNFSGPEPRAVAFSQQDREFTELMARGIGHYLETEQAERRIREQTRRAEVAREEAEQAREEAEEANRAKSTFLHTMSHEVRTPLTAVLGFADILHGDETLGEEQRRFARTIARSGRRLVSLINDVLDLAKIEAEHLQIHPEPTNVVDLVEEALELHLAAAAQKNVELGFEVAPVVPSDVLADGRRLGQVLSNLISNAVKFTEAGRVTVRVGVAAGTLSGDDLAGLSDEAGARLHLQFEVEDTGLGIPPDALGRVFDPFYQVDDAATRRQNGTGLGLAICKELVEAMGGEIGAASTPGEGTTVRFTADVGVEARRRLVYRPAAAGTLVGRRVLVLDDTRANRDLLTTLLRQWGAEPVSVRNGAELLERLDAGETFDAGLFDMELPGHTGADVARLLRRHGASFPLLLLSSIDVDRSEVEGLFEQILLKPLDTSALERALWQALGRSRAEAERAEAEGAEETAPDPPAPSAGASPGAAPKDRREAGLRIVVAEDDPINRELIQTYLNRLGFEPAFAQNGHVLLDMLEDYRPDVVLLDIMMPGMDGLTAARKIQARYEDDCPRLIALTARGLRGDREEILAAGIDDYVSKPFTFGDIEAALERAAR